MGIFSKLKPQKIINTIFSGVDKAVLTKEELLDIAVKTTAANLEFVKATQTESTPRSVSRRIIAKIVLYQTCLSTNVGLVGIITGYYDGFQVLKITGETFLPLTMSVVIFYFGNHIVKAVVSKFANQKVEK